MPAEGLGGRPGGGTSLLLRGTGLFCREVEKAVNGEVSVCPAGCDASCRSHEGGAGGESSVRSMSSGGAVAATCVGKPRTGVRTSGTTSASGGILGRDSLRGPPHAEQDSATGVLSSVQRGQAQSDCCCASRPLTSPLLSERRGTSSFDGR